MSDTEPREFFIEVENWKPGQQIPLKVIYYACDEDNKWCNIVIQNYTLVLDRDAYAGGVIGRSFRAGGGRTMPNRASMASRMMSMDTNKDGLLDKDEVPERMLMRFNTWLSVPMLPPP